MKLEEAIKHLEETLNNPNHEWSCAECKAEHEQLLMWLKDYKRLLEMPKGDLISREALKKALTSETRDIYEFVCLSRILEKIDNAPTVVAYTGTDLIEENKKGFNTARRLYERPQGEWVNTSPYDDKGECSLCNYLSKKYYNFCPNCGADMRGDENEQ